MRELDPCNPIRLGLALNLSIFYYNVIGDKKMGKLLCQETVVMAEDNLDKCEEDTYKEVKRILVLLKEN